MNEKMYIIWLLTVIDCVYKRNIEMYISNPHETNINQRYKML